MKSYFILSGENEYLALEELRALLELHGISPGRLKCLTMVCIIDGVDTGKINSIIDRAGYIREGGTVIKITTILDPPPVIETGTMRFFSVSNLKKTVPDHMVKEFLEGFIHRNNIIHRSGRKSDLHLIFSEGSVIIGKPIASRRTRDFYRRRPAIRPFFRSIALSVPFSRMMINLARTPRGGVIFDPFAGTGSILIEASLMGIKAIGAEIDWKIARGAEENLEYYNANAILILGDSTQLNLYDINAIVTDPPYGRSASTHGVDVKNIYSEFLHRSTEWLKHGSYLVFLAPHYLVDYIDEMLCESGFIVRSRIYHYIHGGLTRVVYVAYLP